MPTKTQTTTALRDKDEPQGTSSRAEDSLGGQASNGIERARVTEIQRARILRATIDVVSTYGAANVTVAHIVGRSGVSRRTFYELFTNRDDCLLAAIEDTIQRVATVVIPVYERSSRWRDRIRDALVAFLGFVEEEPASGRMLIVESLAAGPDALQSRAHALARVVCAIDEGRDEAKKSEDPPPLTAEGVLGGVLSVLHTRLLDPEHRPLLELTGPLMNMIVRPYLGSSAAQKELERVPPAHRTALRHPTTDPLREVEMRLTYRTIRVLNTLAEHPGCSNREIGHASGIQDQGQISKLLTRLSKLELIHNTGAGQARGAPNAWALTSKGAEVERAITIRARS
jgi:AcrR family transcriptional regulator